MRQRQTLMAPPGRCPRSTTQWFAVVAVCVAWCTWRNGIASCWAILVAARAVASGANTPSRLAFPLHRVQGPQRSSALQRRSASQGQEDFKELQYMKQDLEVNRQKGEARRGGKRVGSEVWFDLELPPPFGLRLDDAVSGDCVGVSEVLEGGSAFAHNQEAYVAKEGAEAKMFIQPGDKVIMVNGIRCYTKDQVVEQIVEAKEKGMSTIRVKFARYNRGPITVVFPERAPLTVGARSPLVSVALAAQYFIDYDACEDACSGKCWHIDDRTQEIYQFCIEDQVICDLPSTGGVKNLDVQLKGLAAAVKGEEPEKLSTFDNSEALVLRPCPEIYKRLSDPFVGNWRYPGGEYKIGRSQAGILTYTERDFSGTLNEVGDWMEAELPPHGTIRVRPGESVGISQDMESQFRPTGNNDWGETKTAYRL